jgi:hypothetical protein
LVMHDWRCCCCWRCCCGAMTAHASGHSECPLCEQQSPTMTTEGCTRTAGKGRLKVHACRTLASIWRCLWRCLWAGEVCSSWVLPRQRQLAIVNLPQLLFKIMA